jgi:hypothetical protein
MAEEIAVVAASTDSQEKASETVNELGLRFPIGYGLPLKETASKRRGILHAAGFVLKPDHTIAVAQYSSGPIGRLVWQDVLALVQFQKKQAR